jgi:hypothetical protein
MRPAVLVLLLGLLPLQSALAADPKPEATIKTRAIEANVFLDNQIKADPTLEADCLAEGRKWIDKQAADAAAELKQDPQLFGPLSHRRSLCQRRQRRLHGHPRRASQH